MRKAELIQYIKECTREDGTVDKERLAELIMEWPEGTYKELHTLRLVPRKR